MEIILLALILAVAIVVAVLVLLIYLRLIALIDRLDGLRRVLFLSTRKMHFPRSGPHNIHHFPPPPPHSGDDDGSRSGPRGGKFVLWAWRGGKWVLDDVQQGDPGSPPDEPGAFEGDMRRTFLP